MTDIDNFLATAFKNKGIDPFGHCKTDALEGASVIREPGPPHAIVADIVASGQLELTIRNRQNRPTSYRLEVEIGADRRVRFKPNEPGFVSDHVARLEGNLDRPGGSRRSDRDFDRRSIGIVAMLAGVETIRTAVAEAGSAMKSRFRVLGGGGGESMGERCVVEVDLVGYSPIARAVEQTMGGPSAVQTLNGQILKFIQDALRECRLSENAIAAPRGDGAILLFEEPSHGHAFAEKLHLLTKQHNAGITEELAKRVFRAGVATGQVHVDRDRQLAGDALVRAVRLEAAAHPGEIVVDRATFKRIAPDMQARYGPQEEIPGKHGERFKGHRYPVFQAPVRKAAGPSAPPPARPGTLQRRDVLEALEALYPEDQLDKLCFLIEMPTDLRPRATHPFQTRLMIVLTWAESHGPGLERLMDEIEYLSRST